MFLKAFYDGTARAIEAAEEISVEIVDTDRIGKGLESMVTRKLLTVTAVGLTVGLLAQHATGAEALPVQKAPMNPELVVNAQLFRDDIEGYVRELNRQMLETLNAELRRELAPKVIVASNELRTRS